jgi:hypothetical protein
MAMNSAPEMLRVEVLACEAAFNAGRALAG